MTAVGAELYLVANPPIPATSESALRPALWRSSDDGQTWMKPPDSAAFSEVPGGWTDSVNGLLAHGAGLIAVGARFSADGMLDDAEAWTSSDGTTWTRASVAGASQATMDVIYAVRGGFVAIGTAGSAATTLRIAIWASSDGTSWTPLPQQDVPSGVAMGSVAHGAGRYVAVGEAMRPGASPVGPTEPIWISTDGTHYTMLGLTSAPPPDASLIDAIWTGSAFVAVGNEPSAGAFVWRSSDGLSWQSIALPVSGSHRGVEVDGLAQTSSGLIAVGRVIDSASVTHGMVWASPDGRTWAPVATPSELDNVDLQNATVLDGTTFVDGQDAVVGTSLLWRLVPVAPEAVSTCRTSQLAITQVGGGYAAGTVGAYLRFTNVRDQPCKMQGWPTLVGVTSAGATTQARDVSGALSTPEVTVPPEVMLAPGASAYAAFEGGDNPVGASATCPPPYVTLRITTPGSPDSTTISAWNVNFLPSFGGYLAACVGLGVTPVIPAADLSYLAASPTAPSSP